jgi:3-deoxy-manno-octulosonate cytidylyltransferase (CMP-KDO synthetase)
MERAVGIIPARFGSTRLPGKPLVLINGKPLIYWVWKNASQAKKLDQVIVATDDKRVKETVEKFGGEAILTSAKFASGSDRVAAVARKLDYDIVVNIQGDEPLISAAALDRLVNQLMRDQSVPVATLACSLKDKRKLNNPNVVKVVLDKRGRALYFSRLFWPLISQNYNSGSGQMVSNSYFGHSGVYAFRKKFLFKFVSWKPSGLEKIEKLEQLRILENGYPIKIVKTTDRLQAVDTREDIKAVEKIMRGRNER